MKTILIINHESKTCFIYQNCSTKKQAKEAGLKVDGDLYKFNTKEEAEAEAEIWGNDYSGYNRNYVRL